MAAHKKQRKRIQNTFGIAFDQYDCHKGPARSNDISSKQPGSSVTRQLQRRRQLASNRLQRTLRRKAVKKRLIRFGLVSANTLVLIGVMFFVITSGRVDRPETVAAQKTAEAVVVASRGRRAERGDVFETMSILNARRQMTAQAERAGVAPGEASDAAAADPARPLPTTMTVNLRLFFGLISLESCLCLDHLSARGPEGILESRAMT